MFLKKNFFCSKILQIHLTQTTYHKLYTTEQSERKEKKIRNPKVYEKKV